MDSTANTFLDEISGEVYFVAQVVVQRVFGFAIAGDAVVVVAPCSLACAVSTVEKLVFGLMEVATTLFGYIKFDRHSASWRVVHNLSH